MSGITASEITPSAVTLPEVTLPEVMLSEVTLSEVTLSGITRFPDFENFLYLVWAQTQMAEPPSVTLPTGYTLRYFRDGDEAAYCALVNLDGWRDSGWRCTRGVLEEITVRVVPRGFLLVEETATKTLVATALARHRPDADTYYFPYGGELSVVFVHPDHRRRGLGRAVTAAAVGRLMEIGYSSIYLNCMDGRLPALRMYLEMGFVPLLYNEVLVKRWQEICTHLNWPFTPEQWPHQMGK